jgi:hypothetical protein
MRKSTHTPGVVSPEAMEVLLRERDAAMATVHALPGGRLISDASRSIRLFRQALTDIVGYEWTTPWAMFMDTPFSFGIHADSGDGKEPADVMVLVALDSRPLPTAKTVIFEQHWMGRAANFVRGEATTVYGGKINVDINDYKDVVGLSDTQIPEEVYQAHLRHLKREWLEGLSIEGMYDFEPGTIITFARTQIHCSEWQPHDFLKRSIVMRIRREG